MRILLDTHVLLWLLSNDRKQLAKGARRVLETPDTTGVVSAAVIWEIAMKQGLGKLDAPPNLTHLLEAAGIPTLPVTAGHAELAGRLPAHHRDPFERMLVAQARWEKLPLVTADKALSAYGIETIWN